MVGHRQRLAPARVPPATARKRRRIALYNAWFWVKQLLKTFT